MRNKWGYVAIAAILGVATACSRDVVSFTAVIIFSMYCFWRLDKIPFLICMASLFLFLFYTNEVEKRNQPLVSSSTAPLVATIVSSPEIDGDRITFNAKTKEQERLRMFYKITSPEEKRQLESLQTGVVCTFTGERDSPQPARNFGAFNYKEYLRHQQIHFLYNVSSFTSCYKHPSLWQWLLSVRQQAVLYVQDRFSEETAAFINALVYGDRRGISSEIEESYQQLGLIHLLAISGSHITMLAAACYYVLLRIGSTRESATALLLVIIFCYMYMAGASPSVVRASVTAIIVLLSLLLCKRVSGLDALGLAAICMLAFNPYDLFDIGFQFSFSATFVLLLSSFSIFSADQPPLRNMWNVAFVAQLASLPISLHYFGQISPYSLPLNLLYVPFLSIVILPLCLGVLGLSVLFPIAAVWLHHLLSFLLSLSNQLLLLSDNLPFQMLTFGQSPWWLTVAYYVVMIWIFVAWEDKRQKRQLVRASGLLLFLLIGHYTAPFFNPYGKITFLDVGQGDCILIQLPYAKGTYMIDTGGALTLPKQQWQQRKYAFSIGMDIVVPYLKSAGVRHIDKLILTHGDQDHAGAAIEVLSAVSIGEVVLGQANDYSQLEENILQHARQNNIPISFVERGMSWKAGSTFFEVLAPSGEEEKENDQSIVLHAQIGGLTWLFTGDLEEKGEKHLVKTFVNLQADVLKVGHHGSNTSTSDVFLQAVQPRFAIILAGRNNRYGHPHQEVLERLEKSKVSIWRTDEDGAIIYTFLNDKGTFRKSVTYDESTRSKRKK